MITTETASNIAHVIELALAPVFLLTGIAGLLGVMTNRLARIIDRGRYFERHWDELDDEARADGERELNNLERRRRMASRAIAFGTLAALLVCLVVASLFFEALTEWRLKGVAGVLFFLSMLSLIAGLALFLREVFLATRTVRVPRVRRHPPQASPAGRAGHTGRG